MAQGLMGLQNLLGQSSNAQQQSGLLGGGVFSQPESRGRRRSRLLNEAIAGAGQNPYARLGASFGGLIGMGGRAAAEGLGIVDAPQEVQQSDAIRQVQKEVADRGLDPMSTPREFGDFVAGRFQELGQPQLATRSLLQARQIESQFAPQQPELPAAAQNLAFRAQQAGLEPGTPEYQEFMRTGGEIEQGPTTTVNVGQQGQQFPDPPRDTVWARDEEGNVLTEEREVDGRTVRAPVSVPITGSKPAREAEEERREREFSAKSANRAASIVVDDFDFLLRGLGADTETGEIGEDADPSVVGPRMRMAAEQGTFGSNVLFAGGETGDFLRQLESARNTIAVDQLLNIKREGSGLGQVPQSQLDTLSTLLGSLEAGLSNEKLAENLARAKRLYTNIIETSLQDVDDPTFRGVVLGIAGMAEERGVLDENNNEDRGANSSESSVVDWSDL